MGLSRSALARLMSPYLPSARACNTCNIVVENNMNMKGSKEIEHNIHNMDNQNETWLSERGAWLTYFILVVFLHLVLLSVPFFDTATAWTMTNMIHNLVNIEFNQSDPNLIHYVVNMMLRGTYNDVWSCVIS